MGTEQSWGWITTHREGASEAGRTSDGEEPVAETEDEKGIASIQNTVGVGGGGWIKGLAGGGSSFLGGTGADEEMWDPTRAVEDGSKCVSV